MKLFRVVLSHISERYQFADQEFFTEANSESKACYNVYYRENDVKSLVKRDLGVLKAYEVSTNIKSSQVEILEILNYNYEDILEYERTNIIV